MSFRSSQGYVLGSDGPNPPFPVIMGPVPLTDGCCTSFLLFKGWGMYPGSLGASQHIISEGLRYLMTLIRSGFFKKLIGTKVE